MKVRQCKVLREWRRVLSAGCIINVKSAADLLKNVDFLRGGDIDIFIKEAKNEESIFGGCRDSGGEHGGRDSAEDGCFYTVIEFHLTDGTTKEVKIPGSEAAPGTTYEAATTEEAVDLYRNGVENVEFTADSYSAATTEELTALLTLGAPEVSLTADISVPEIITVDSDVTLDLGESTLSVGGGIGNYVAIRVNAGGTLTIDGNGTIDATGADDTTVPVAAMQEGATVIVNSGTIVVDTPKESCLYAGGGGKVIVNDGTFINSSDADYEYGDSVPLTVNVSNSASVDDLVVYGGTFTGRDPALGDDNLGGTFVAEGYVSYESEDGTYVVCSEEDAVAAGMVATVGASAYVTFEEAVAALNAIEGTDTVTLTLISDCTIDTGVEITRSNVIIQGNGNGTDTTLTALDDGSSGQAAIYIQGADNVTIQNLTVKLSGGSADASPVKATFGIEDPAEGSDSSDTDDVSENVTITNVVLIGNNLGHGLNLHGVSNAKVSNVTIENYAKCGISIAFATGVDISNVTFKDAECWADIGLMYGSSDIYGTPVTGVALGAGITFAANALYAESAGYGVPTGYESYGLTPITTSESGNSWNMIAIVYIKSGEVTLNNISVEGNIQNFYDAFYSSGTPVSGYDVVGIAVCNASLTANEVNVRNIGIATSDDANYFGVQTGIAVVASAAATGEYNVTFNDGTVEGFQKGGFVARANINLFTLNGVTVTGCGATALTAQNAVQVACNSVIEDCVIANVEYTPEGSSASGILLVSMDGKTVNGETVTAENHEGIIAVINDAGNTFSSVVEEVNFY